MPLIGLAPPFSEYIGRDAPRSSNIGQVLYGLQGRQIARNFTRPTNPRSIDQVDSRLLLSAASIAWNTLTDPQQADWYALGALYTRTDKSGQQYQLSGKAVFVASYCNAAQAGGTPGSTPNPFESAPVILSIDSAVYTPTTGPLTINFTTAATTGGATVWISSPLGTGIRRINSTKLTLVADPPDAFADFAADNNSFAITNADIRRSILVGDRIAIRMRPLDDANLISGVDTVAILTVT